MPMPARLATFLQIAVLAVLLVGAAVAITWEGWLLQEQDRRITLLEEAIDHLRGQNLQMSHGITTGQSNVDQILRNLKVKVEALQPANGGQGGSDQPARPQPSGGSSGETSPTP